MGVFEYLIVDIEWNQAEETSGLEGRDPVQIGIIGLDENLENIKTFSRGICLPNIELLTEKTCKVVHMTKEVIMQGKSEIEVYLQIAKTFLDYKYIVVWTRDTYELFKSGMKKSGALMPKHKVIVLQDVIGFIATKRDTHIGFETALIQAEIPYKTNFLHYAKHDAEYLYQLYQYLYQKYSEITENEKCIPNYNTNKLHLTGCRYIRNKEMNTPTVNKNLIFQGFIPCLHCGTEANWRRLKWKSQKKVTKHNSPAVKINYSERLRNLPLCEKNIIRICKQFSLQCSISVNVVFVKTHFGVWRIYYQDNYVTDVYHENYKMKKSEFLKKRKANEGFHKQNVESDNFYDVIRYIYYHDKDFMKRHEKKNKIELLFEQLEKTTE